MQNWVSVIHDFTCSFAYFPDPPKDNGGSEILKYLLEITDGNSEGQVLGMVYSNPVTTLFANMINIYIQEWWGGINSNDRAINIKKP